MMNEPKNDDLKSGIIRRMIQVLVTILVQASVLFLAAGTLRWWAAWVYVFLYLGGVSVNTFFMMRANPETIVERGRGTASPNWKDWDKVVGTIFGVLYFIGILLVAGLDKRFSWTGNMNLSWQIGAFVAYALGGALFSWAMVTNAFFSTAVRIQDERGHQVCTTGPYRIVRHPGYVGVSLQSLVTPVMLGSWWGLITGGLAALLLVVRTALEDKTLHEELAGYREFAYQTRYRLLPGIW